MIDLPGHDGYGADTYGESFADVYDDWYADVSDVDATVATIARLAGEGPVLELGVGTGRLAIPLANIDFVIEPYVRFEGLPGEQKTMFFYDNSGNALEFKSFKDMEMLFSTKL